VPAPAQPPLQPLLDCYFIYLLAIAITAFCCCHHYLQLMVTFLFYCQPFTKVTIAGDFNNCHLHFIVTLIFCWPLSSLLATTTTGTFG